MAALSLESARFAPDSSGLSGTSTWVLKKTHTFGFSEHISSHSDAEFEKVVSVPAEELEEYAQIETAFELVKGEDEETSCTLTVTSADRSADRSADCSAIVGAVLVCSSATIELYASAGYISTSRGSLIVEDEDLVLYGHLIDLRMSPVFNIDFRVFPKSKTTSAEITFLGFHIFVKATPPRPVRHDSGNTLRSQLFPSPFSGGGAGGVPVDVLCHKLDSLKTELKSFEIRLKTHFDNQIDALRRDVFLRLDRLQSKTTADRASSPPPSPDEKQQK